MRFTSANTPIYQTARNPSILAKPITTRTFTARTIRIVALTTAASVITRFRLGTFIFLIAQRDPIVTAKQFATLDRLSGGRVVVGCGPDGTGRDGRPWRSIPTPVARGSRAHNRNEG